MLNDTEKKKMIMYEEVLTFLRENREVIAGLPGINQNVKKLFRVMDEIRRIEKILSFETLKRTNKINEVKENLIFLALPIVSMLFRLAKDKNDVLLKQRTKQSKSHFILYKNYELLNKSIQLAAMAEKYSKELNKYGINNAAIISLNKSIQEFQIVTSSIYVDCNHNNLSIMLEKLFVNADMLISNIDDLIENFVEDEVFYEEYQWTKSLDYNEELQEKEEFLYEMEES